jgi:hypothetical protein
MTRAATESRTAIRRRSVVGWSEAMSSNSRCSGPPAAAADLARSASFEACSARTRLFIEEGSLSNDQCASWGLQAGEFGVLKITTIVGLVGAIAATVAALLGVFSSIRPPWHPNVTGHWSCKEHCQHAPPGYFASVRYENGVYIFRNEVGLESRSGRYDASRTFLVEWPTGTATAKLNDAGNELRWSSGNTLWVRTAGPHE